MGRADDAATPRWETCQVTVQSTHPSAAGSPLLGIGPSLALPLGAPLFLQGDSFPTDVTVLPGV